MSANRPLKNQSRQLPESALLSRSLHKILCIVELILAYVYIAFIVSFFFLKLIVFLHIALCAAIIKFLQNSLSQNFKEPLNTPLYHVLKSIRWSLVLCLALHPPSSCSSLHPQVLLPKISFCFSSSLDLLFLGSYVFSFLSLFSLLAKPSPAEASWERMKGKSPHC